MNLRDTIKKLSRLVSARYLVALSPFYVTASVVSLSARVPTAAPAATAARADRNGRVLDTATFAGGCFWSIEVLFDEFPGVISATSGFMGGTRRNPRYDDVITGTTGHAESVQVVFDPARVSYAQLVDAFWHDIDPTTVNRAFCDPGSQYRSVIFYRNAEQRRIAEDSKRELERSRRFERVVTGIEPASAFYAAEAYHQDFARKNPVRYAMYKVGCRREQRLTQVWGKDAHKGARSQ